MLLPRTLDAKRRATRVCWLGARIGTHASRRACDALDIVPSPRCGVFAYPHNVCYNIDVASLVVVNVLCI